MKYKILVVDDEYDVHQIIKIGLSSKLFHIISATSGDEAIRLSISEKPDLILLDIMMPDHPDGLETCKLLKRRDDTKNIGIIFLTVRAQEFDIESGLEAGAIDYITKPFTLSDLKSQIEKHLLN